MHSSSDYRMYDPDSDPRGARGHHLASKLYLRIPHELPMQRTRLSVLTRQDDCLSRILEVTFKPYTSGSPTEEEARQRISDISLLINEAGISLDLPDPAKNLSLIPRLPVIRTALRKIARERNVQIPYQT